MNVDVDLLEDGPANDAVFDMIVEIPKGSRNRYEIDVDSGAIWLDRQMFTTTSYPADIGFVPGTLAQDGDPLDVLLLLDEPTFPGCNVTARAIGIFWMQDEIGPDATVLAVPAGDSRWDHIQVLGDLPPYIRAELDHFFEMYMSIEPSKSSEVSDWGGKTEAVREIDASQRRHGEQA